MENVLRAGFFTETRDVSVHEISHEWIAQRARQMAARWIAKWAAGKSIDHRARAAREDHMFRISETHNW